MTAQPTEQQPLVVTPAADSRLEQLHAVYAGKKAAADAAAKELKDVTDAIKAELTAAAPGQERVSLVGSYGPQLDLAYVERWTFDSTRFKADDPVTYVQYAKKGGSWRLEAAKGGE